MKTIVMLTVASPLYTPSILKVMLKVCDATWCNRAPNQIKETLICTTISTLVPRVSFLSFPWSLPLQEKGRRETLKARFYNL